MCDTHTHGPAAVATPASQVRFENFLPGATKHLSDRITLALEETLQHPVLNQFFDAQDVGEINKQTSPARQIAYIVDKITTRYTQLASQAYKNGNTQEAKKLMDEMKISITEVQNIIGA